MLERLAMGILEYWESWQALCSSMISMSAPPYGERDWVVFMRYGTYKAELMKALKQYRNPSVPGCNPSLSPHLSCALPRGERVSAGKKNLSYAGGIAIWLRSHRTALSGQQPLCSPCEGLIPWQKVPCQHFRRRSGKKYSDPQAERNLHHSRPLI